MNTSHGTYILAILLHNLAKNGFCAPEPPSEMNDDKNLHEGTGLGDGEGAQNNSKDVEEDEDLTENAQEANNDQREKDEEDPDENKNDAVEMEGDMAGDLEEISDQESNDENSNEENEEELDEQVDDVNEDDPNAIDDKMWDEKPDTDSKEKNSDKNLDGKNDEPDIQAAEDENSEADNNQQQGENENDNSDEPDNNSKENNSQHEESGQEEEGQEEEMGSEQEDSVRQEDGDELATDAPEIEALELPEDINLDSGDEKGEEDNDKMDLSDESGDEEDDEKRDDTMEDKSNSSEFEAEEDSEMKDIDEMDENKQPDEEQNSQEEIAEDAEDGNKESINEDENMSDEGSLVEDQVGEDAEHENGIEEQAEALDGLDEDQENAEMDASATAQQKSNSKGTGSDSKDSNEQENIGNTGDSQANQQNEQQQEDLEASEATREEAKEALKQLGDSMKEYHNRRKEINEASQNQQEEQVENASERPDEFEHVDGANTETDTQALGMANQEQILPIDEDNAIEEDIDETNKDEDINMLDERDDQEDQNGQPEDFNNVEEQESGRKSGTTVEDMREDLHRGTMTEEEVLQDRGEIELDPLLDDIEEEVNEQDEFAEPPRGLEESRVLWHKSELATADLSSLLSEQLRLILEPTLATKLQGDYKTGKRLNMKRIIPYIASQFRKDKIWLRRTKPSKRQYQIMIALDDSKSMSESKCVKLAFDSLCLVSKTLTQLEAGGLSIVKFGETVKEVHPFGEQFSSEAGARAFQWFGFQETKTDVRKLVAESIKIFEKASAFANEDQWQLQIVISDGVCEDHETLQRLVRRARENKIMIIFVIIDGINTKESIMDMSQVKYVPDQNGNMLLKIDKYLDTFPFEFYVVVHDISELPQMLSVILKQYFADLASS